jgi:cytokinin dehydrogenase
MGDDATRELALSSDLEIITGAADDFGHIVHKVPDLVAFPCCADEVASVMRYGAERGVRVVPRGAGHSVFGQAQCDGGTVCDMSTVNSVAMTDSSTVAAGAGARWGAVLDVCLRHGLTPPVLTDYLELSVGGTLSVGGIGGTAHVYGPQVDHVRELEVVTPVGERVICSPDRDADVFFGVLGGGGGSGIIVRASIPLVAAHERVRVYRVPFPTVGALIVAQTKLAQELWFDYIEGQILRDENGAWRFIAEVGAYHGGDSVVDDRALDGIGAGSGPIETEDMTYLDFCRRMVPGVRLLAATGDWYRPHPWFSVFLPVNAVERYVNDALAGLTPETLGPVPMLLYPLRRGPAPATGLVTPAGEGMFFSFSILRTAATDEAVAISLARNEQLEQAALAVGGTRYGISTMAAFRLALPRQHGRIVRCGW